MVIPQVAQAQKEHFVIAKQREHIRAKQAFAAGLGDFEPARSQHDAEKPVSSPRVAELTPNFSSMKSYHTRRAFLLAAVLKWNDAMNVPLFVSKPGSRRSDASSPFSRRHENRQAGTPFFFRQSARSERSA
jgi:hypothetical protein